MDDKERDDYRTAFSLIPPDDIDWVIGEILYNRIKRSRERECVGFKVCDTCNRTYPLYTTVCNKCSNDKRLRVVDNIPPTKNEIVDMILNT